jgi:hypothetical protein
MRKLFHWHYVFSFYQCCGSGSGVRCLFEFGMGKKSGSVFEIRIRDEQPGSYFQELRKHFLGLSGMEKIRIQDPDAEWKKFGSGIIIPEDPGYSSQIRNTGFYTKFISCAMTVLFHVIRSIVPYINSLLKNTPLYSTYVG